MIKLKNVQFRYKKKPILNHINLELHESTYGLLGPNGAGKTTMLRCMTGLLVPQVGSIEVPEKIGYLPQKFGFFKQLTVYETLEYFSALKKIPKEYHRDFIMECLRQVNLSERAKDKMGSLSGGMVRRVGIAQALLGDPELVIFDEPTAGLDPEERLRFHNILGHIQKDRTVLVSTHIIEDVVSSCNHIIVLNQGTILSSGTADALAKRAEGKVYSIPFERKSELQEPYTIIREDALNQTLRIVSDIMQQGEKMNPTVEDGFMLTIRGVS